MSAAYALFGLLFIGLRVSSDKTGALMRGDVRGSIGRAPHAQVILQDTGCNAATLKQRFPSRSREGPNRVPLARMGIAATGRTFRAASEAAEGRENERSQRPN